MGIPIDQYNDMMRRLEAASVRSAANHIAKQVSLLKPPIKKPTKPVKQRKTSHLEEKFARMWEANHGWELVREHRFDPKRRWKFDFAQIGSKTAIEIEGGIWNGRHTRGVGFHADCEKYFAATMAGWVVVRLTPGMIDQHHLRCVANLITSRMSGF